MFASLQSWYLATLPGTAKATLSELGDGELHVFLWQQCSSRGETYLVCRTVQLYNSRTLTVDALRVFTMSAAALLSAHSLASGAVLFVSLSVVLQPWMLVFFLPADDLVTVARCCVIKLLCTFGVTACAEVENCVCSISEVKLATNNNSSIHSHAHREPQWTTHPVISGNSRLEA